MANTETIAAGRIIADSLLSPFIRFRRFLWEAGFFIISGYLLVIGLTSLGVLTVTHNVVGEIGAALVTLAVLAAYMAVAIDFLVRWHETAASDDAASRSPFLPRFNKIHLRYFLYLLALSLLGAVVSAILGLAVYMVLSGLRVAVPDRSTVAYFVIAFLTRIGLTTILIALLGRFLLMLPIIAAGGEKPRDSAASLYRNHGWSVTLALGGVSLILMLFQFAFGLLISPIQLSPNPVMVSFQLRTFLMPPVVAIEVGIFASALTMTYKQLAALQRPEAISAT